MTFSNLLLLLLLAVHGAPTRSTAGDHGGDRRGTKGSGQRERLGTLGIATHGSTRSRSEGNKPAASANGGLEIGATAAVGTKDRKLAKRGGPIGITMEIVDVAGEGDVVVDDGKPFDEPPPLTNMKSEWVQRCLSFNESNFEQGAVCGGPLSEPCFERSRCETGEGGATMVPKIYVYDQEVGWH